MNPELKDAIIKDVQKNKDDFQLVNTTIGNFSQYIYNADGAYIIGGEQVAKFYAILIK